MSGEELSDVIVLLESYPRFRMMPALGCDIITGVMHICALVLQSFAFEIDNSLAHIIGY